RSTASWTQRAEATPPRCPAPPPTHSPPYAPCWPASRQSQAASACRSRASLGVWHGQAGPDPTWRGLAPPGPRVLRAPIHAKKPTASDVERHACRPSDRSISMLEKAWLSQSPPWGQAPPLGVRPRLAAPDPDRLTPIVSTPIVSRSRLRLELAGDQRQAAGR